MAFCEKCGNPIAPNAAFCGRCGAACQAAPMSATPVTPPAPGYQHAFAAGMHCPVCKSTNLSPMIGSSYAGVLAADNNSLVCVNCGKQFRTVQAVQESLRSAASYIRYRATDRGKAELLYNYLTTRFIYVEQETTTPLYSALCAGIADAAGLAQAWQLICQQIPMDCYVVNGLRDGEPWTWNIVSYDGYYRHLDLHSCIMEEQALVLRTDEEMSRYYWNASQFPVCEPIPIQEPQDQELPDGQQTPETNAGEETQQQEG